MRHPGVVSPFGFRRVLIGGPRRVGAGWLASLACVLASAPVLRAQDPVQIEDFEFASSDEEARRGVIDLTDPPNQPAYYISGADEKASEGQYSIGTDVVYCINQEVECLPGTFEGFRRLLDPARFADRCPGGGAYVPLRNTYGDPEHPGREEPGFPIAELAVIADLYGDGGFADGLTGTHMWVSLVDCEGEIFNFVNYSEVSLYSEIWTWDVRLGQGLIRLSPNSLEDVPDGDRLLTEIAAIEVLIQDEDDPPTTTGKWYIDDLRIVEPIAPRRLGDLDGDGRIDLADYRLLADCLEGPSVNVEGDCLDADFDDDVDVDLKDAAAFLALFDSSR